MPEHSPGFDKNGNRLKSDSPLPLHYQLREIIRFEALNGDLADKDGKMPTENELIERFKVSRITVRNALDKLVDQGLLRRERGKGTFLKSNTAVSTSGELGSIVMTISLAAAAFLDDCAGRAPSSTKSATACLLMSNTVNA